jgi:dCTP diphosphatase
MLVYPQCISGLQPPAGSNLTGYASGSPLDLSSASLNYCHNMTFAPRCLDSIRAEAAEFARERDWEQFHSPRNLLLAVVSEVGELAEVVRWSGDNEPAITEANRQAWEDELADVFILLVRLADRSGVDLSTAFAKKLQKAREKYPVDEFKGSARKSDR